jgi:hypothetical protein
MVPSHIRRNWHAEPFFELGRERHGIQRVQAVIAERQVWIDVVRAEAFAQVVQEPGLDLRCRPRHATLRKSGAGSAARRGSQMPQRRITPITLR